WRFLMLMLFEKRCLLMTIITTIKNQNGILAMGVTERSLNSCFRNLWWAAIAIIAALSVQYSMAGMKTFHFSVAAISVSFARNPLLAETPPAIAISWIPVMSLASFNLESSIPIRCA